jgi:hypothetical protein
MKSVFVLTRPEQRLIIILVLLLVAGAWVKHHRDTQTNLQSRNVPVTDEGGR